MDVRPHGDGSQPQPLVIAGMQESCRWAQRLTGRPTRTPVPLAPPMIVLDSHYPTTSFGCGQLCSRSHSLKERPLGKAGPQREQKAWGYRQPPQRFNGFLSLSWDLSSRIYLPGKEWRCQSVYPAVGSHGPKTSTLRMSSARRRGGGAAPELVWPPGGGESWRSQSRVRGDTAFSPAPHGTEQTKLPLAGARSKASPFKYTHFWSI